MKKSAVNAPVRVYYHGTTRENWEKAKKTGVFYGVNAMKFTSNCTYLTTVKEEAKSYGEVLLEITYKPNGIDDNFSADCHQFAVFAPILLKDIKEYAQLEWLK